MMESSMLYVLYILYAFHIKIHIKSRGIFGRGVLGFELRAYTFSRK
jgi:hypothetical protein